MRSVGDFVFQNRSVIFIIVLSFTIYPIYQKNDDCRIDSSFNNFITSDWQADEIRGCSIIPSYPLSKPKQLVLDHSKNDYLEIPVVYNQFYKINRYDSIDIFKKDLIIYSSSPIYLIVSSFLI